MFYNSYFLVVYGYLIYLFSIILVLAWIIYNDFNTSIMIYIKEPIKAS